MTRARDKRTSPNYSPRLVGDVVRRVRGSGAAVLQPGARPLDLHVAERQDDVLHLRYGAASPN